ncbi:hypothetical protein JCM8547_000706 [Rhodosporidiobolus lusitaniae]
MQRDVLRRVLPEPLLVALCLVCGTLNALFLAPLLPFLAVSPVVLLSSLLLIELLTVTFRGPKLHAVQFFGGIALALTASLGLTRIVIEAAIGDERWNGGRAKKQTVYVCVLVGLLFCVGAVGILVTGCRKNREGGISGDEENGRDDIERGEGAICLDGSEQSVSSEGDLFHEANEVSEGGQLVLYQAPSLDFSATQERIGNAVDGFFSKAKDALLDATTQTPPPPGYSPLPSEAKDAPAE